MTRGKFSHLLRPCTRNAIPNNQAHLTEDKLKRLQYSIYSAESVNLSSVPSGIYTMHSAMTFFSCDCVVVVHM